MTDAPPLTSALPSVADVRGILAGVLDPELGASIVDLGMVREIVIEGRAGEPGVIEGRAGEPGVNETRAGEPGVNETRAGEPGVIEGAHVVIEVALTTAACPLRGQIATDVKNKVAGVAGVGTVDVQYVEMTQTERSAVMQRARLEASKRAPETAIAATTRVIAVASGKGGVGKSSITVNLAAALAARGLTVGVLDADIWGFSVPRLLGIAARLKAKKVDGKGVIEPESLAIGAGELRVVSMGLLLDDEDTALMWRGLILAKALEQFLTDVHWGDLDYLLIDMPPGTGDIQMALSRLLPQAELLVVTTPAKNAQKVASRVADMARRSYLKVLGIVENMTVYVAPDGSEHEIFGAGGGQRLAKLTGAPLIGRVPIEPAVSSTGDDGRPVVIAHADSAAARELTRIATEITESLLPPVEMSGCTARMTELLAQFTKPE